MQPLNEHVAWLQKELDALKAAGSDPAQMSRARAIEIAEEALGLLRMVLEDPASPEDEVEDCADYAE